MAAEGPGPGPSFVEAAGLFAMFAAGAKSVAATVAVAAAVETDYSKKQPKMTPAKATDSQPSYVEYDPFVEFQGASQIYSNSADIVNYSTRC